jgi:hypothetical protein
MRIVDQVLPFELKERIEKRRLVCRRRNWGFEPRESIGKRRMREGKVRSIRDERFPLLNLEVK